MKNLVKAILIGVVFSTTACSSDDNQNAAVEQNLVFENNNEVIIPDATGGWFDPTVSSTVTSTIQVDALGVIAKPWKVNISLELNYIFASGTTFELYAPSGESCKLIEKLNSEYVAGNIITFNSGAVSPIPKNSFPVATGSYLPSTGVNNVQADDLAEFLEGKNIDGVWTLKITDAGVDDVDVFDVDEKLIRWRIEFDKDALQ